MSRVLTQSQGLCADPRYRGLGVFDPAAFRSWCEMHFYQPIGTSGDGRMCPLARWLSDCCGVAYEVGEGRYWPAGTQLSRSLPAWARLFMQALSRAFPCGEVTGGQVLSVLSKAR
jgi:hypothetical protein